MFYPRRAKYVRNWQTDNQGPNVVATKPGGVQLKTICSKLCPEAQNVKLKIAIPCSNTGVDVDVCMKVASNPGPPKGKLHPVAAEG